MTKQRRLKQLKHSPPEAITISSSVIKTILEDDDIERLEYPANEFPFSQTKIIIVFSKQSGKEPQFIELQDWLDLVEDYQESQQAVKKTSKQYNSQGSEHGEEFVCVVSFRINGDDNNVGKVVVSQEGRDDCVNAILEKYPNTHLDFSIEFMCKKCFENLLTEELEESEYGNYYGSRMIH